MKNMPAVHEAIKNYANNSSILSTYTKYSILVAEEDQIFVQFDGVPNRGSLTVWVKLPEECQGDPWEIAGTISGDALVGYAEEDEEPRTVAFLRNEIDDLDHDLYLAKGVIKREEHQIELLPFLRLTIANAEDRRHRLLKELEELSDDVLDYLERKNNPTD